MRKKKVLSLPNSILVRDGDAGGTQPATRPGRTPRLLLAQPGGQRVRAARSWWLGTLLLALRRQRPTRAPPPPRRSATTTWRLGSR
jgi:hypothetical protein